MFYFSHEVWLSLGVVVGLAAVCVVAGSAADPGGPPEEMALWELGGGEMDMNCHCTCQCGVTAGRLDRVIRC